MEREGKKHDISSAPATRRALNVDRKSHEADPPFTAEETRAGTRGTAPRLTRTLAPRPTEAKGQARTTVDGL